MTRSVARIAVLMLVAACGDGVAAAPIDASPVPPDARAAPDALAPLPPSRDVDILYVIDNSGSMGEEQVSLTLSFPSRLTDVLAQRFGTLPNVHIGIVSSNMGVGGYAITGCDGDGDGGRLLSGARTACTPPDGAYISDVENPDGSRSVNYSGTIGETYSCIAHLGIDGCGFEQHFEAMRRALDGSNPENDGFLRPDAYLAVLFVADEDDCSATNTALFDPDQTTIDSHVGPLSSFRCTEFGVECDGQPLTRTPASYTSCQPRTGSYLADPADYVAFLKALKPDPRMLIVGALVGNATPFVVGADAEGHPLLEPSCTSGAGEAAPSVRFRALLEEFEHSGMQSVCNDDLSLSVAFMADVIADAMQAPNP